MTVYLAGRPLNGFLSYLQRREEGHRLPGSGFLSRLIRPGRLLILGLRWLPGEIAARFRRFATRRIRPVPLTGRRALPRESREERERERKGGRYENESWRV